MSAMRAHDLQNLFARDDNPTDEEILRAAYRAPVQKLDWRKSYPLERFEKLLVGRPTIAEDRLPVVKQPNKVRTFAGRVARKLGLRR